LEPLGDSTDSKVATDAHSKVANDALKDVALSLGFCSAVDYNNVCKEDPAKVRRRIKELS